MTGAAFVVVLQVDPQDPLLLVLDAPVVLDELLAQEDLEDLLLDPEAGTSTRLCLASAALRMQVSMSAIGSVTLIGLRLPYQLALTTPGSSPLEGELAARRSGTCRTSAVRARAAAAAAAVVACGP